MKVISDPPNKIEPTIWLPNTRPIMVPDPSFHLRKRMVTFKLSYAGHHARARNRQLCPTDEISGQFGLVSRIGRIKLGFNASG